MVEKITPFPGVTRGGTEAGIQSEIKSKQEKLEKINRQLSGLFRKSGLVDKVTSTVVETSINTSYQEPNDKRIANRESTREVNDNLAKTNAERQVLESQRANLQYEIDRLKQELIELQNQRFLTELEKWKGSDNVGQFDAWLKASTSSLRLSTELTRRISEVRDSISDNARDKLASETTGLLEKKAKEGDLPEFLKLYLPPRMSGLLESSKSIIDRFTGESQRYFNRANAGFMKMNIARLGQLMMNGLRFIGNLTPMELKYKAVFNRQDARLTMIERANRSLEIANQTMNNLIPNMVEGMKMYFIDSLRNQGLRQAQINEALANQSVLFPSIARISGRRRDGELSARRGVATPNNLSNASTSDSSEIISPNFNPEAPEVSAA